MNPPSPGSPAPGNAGRPVRPATAPVDLASEASFAKPLTVSIARKTPTPTPGAPTPAESAAPTPAVPKPAPEIARLGPLAMATEPPLPGAVPSEVKESTPAPRPRSPWERFVAWFAQPIVVAPVVITCLVILGWVILVRRTAHPIVVRARPMPLAQSSIVTPEEVQALAARATLATGSVLTNLDELPRLVSSLEQQARTAGFAVEVSTLPPVQPVPGIPELRRHPVVFKLENNADLRTPAFYRLLDWLRLTATAGVRIEPGPITLQSPGHGLTLATVELGLLMYSADAKAPPK